MAGLYVQCMDWCFEIALLFGNTASSRVKPTRAQPFRLLLSWEGGLKLEVVGFDAFETRLYTPKLSATVFALRRHCLRQSMESDLIGDSISLVISLATVAFLLILTSGFCICRPRYRVGQSWNSHGLERKSAGMVLLLLLPCWSTATTSASTSFN